MGKTIINVAITMADDEWDRYEKRFESPSHNSLILLENTMGDTLWDELGIISKAKVTKIE